MRNETALRLSVGSDTAQVSVKVTDGFPPPLADVLWQFRELAPLLLNKNSLEQTEKGLQIVDKHFQDLSQLATPAFGRALPNELKGWLQCLIDKLNNVKITEQLHGIEQDLLGAYFFHKSRVEIYWAAIRGC